MTPHLGWLGRGSMCDRADSDPPGRQERRAAPVVFRALQAVREAFERAVKAGGTASAYDLREAGMAVFAKVSREVLSYDTSDAEGGLRPFVCSGRSRWSFSSSTSPSRAEKRWRS
jgi:hypothetical protein